MKVGVAILLLFGAIIFCSALSAVFSADSNDDRYYLDRPNHKTGKDTNPAEQVPCEPPVESVN